MFGDILSDEAAMLTGSLGLLPSASLGAKDKNGKMRSMYEPIHGSYPEATGKNIANPIASILSTSMMLDYSFNLKEESNLIKIAVEKCLNDDYTTPDLNNGNKSYSTSQVGDYIVDIIKEYNQ